MKDNYIIEESIKKTKTVLDKHNNISVSLSGGSDSDIILDIIHRNKGDKNVNYVWFDTGLEYQATKEHLKYLEEKYQITIDRKKPEKPIPLACKEYGQPFMSKQISEYIMRLQKHKFKWEDKPFDELLKEYPKCKSALKWWCNNHGVNSSFNIERKRFLKEFMIENPPQFAISNKCCHYTKKILAKNYIKENEIDLNIVGIRKAEGGARATAHKSCYYDNTATGSQMYLPILYYTNKDKSQYNKEYEITNNSCYSEYGLRRTGCTGCPYARGFEEELEIARIHEPLLYKAATKVFNDAYEYTRKYREYSEIKKQLEKEEKENN